MMRPQLSVTSLLSLLLCLAAVPAHAANEPSPSSAPDANRTSALRSLRDDSATSGMAIAAIVNDEVISGFDLDQRVKLVVGSSGFQPTPAEMERIRSQVLRSLIDEKLKAQEAKRLKVDVKDQEVIDQLTYIASRNNMTVEDIKKELKGQGVSIFTLTDQIKIDIAWNELVQGRYGDQARINQEEVDRVMIEVEANKDKPQYDVLEIFLPVDSLAEDAKVHQQGVDIIEQLKQGRQFGQLAQSFSQDASAAGGGEIGWRSQGQMQPELDAWLKKAHRGEITLEPIKTLAGYYILGVRDTRNVAAAPSDARALLTLKVLFIDVPLNASGEAARRAEAQLKSVAAKVNGCNSVDEVARAGGIKIQDLGQRPASSLPREVQQQISRMQPGTAWGTPNRTNDGWETIVFCGQSQPEQQQAEDRGAPTEQMIKEQLFDQQMSMLSRRYLRDLRRDAVIDSRLAATEE